MLNNLTQGLQGNSFSEVLSYQKNFPLDANYDGVSQIYWNNKINNINHWIAKVTSWFIRENPC